MSDKYFVVRRGAVAVQNSTLQDRRLDIPALGLLALMLATPPGAPMGYRAYERRGLGRTSLLTAIAQLEAAGHRWRFAVRRSGQWRTLTVVFDVPVDEAEARAMARSLTGDELGDCLSRRDISQSRSLPLGDASTVDPQVDENEETAPSPQSSNKSPSRTVRRSAGARAAEPRSTVPRSTRAQPSNDGSREPKGSRPNQTSTARDESANGVEGLAGSGLDGLLDQAVAGVESEDWELLLECLPASMRRIDPNAIAKVAAALKQRLDAGWNPDALRATLAGNRLPPETEIRNLTGIVTYRIGQIPVHPPERRKRRTRPAPQRQDHQQERPLALRLRDEARAKGLPEGEKSVKWWLEQYPPRISGGESSSRAVSA